MSQSTLSEQGILVDAEGTLDSRPARLQRSGWSFGHPAACASSTVHPASMSSASTFVSNFARSSSSACVAVSRQRSGQGKCCKPMQPPKIMMTSAGRGAAWRLLAPHWTSGAALCRRAGAIVGRGRA